MLTSLWNILVFLFQSCPLNFQVAKDCLWEGMSSSTLELKGHLRSASVFIVTLFVPSNEKLVPCCSPFLLVVLAYISLYSKLIYYSKMKDVSNSENNKLYVVKVILQRGNKKCSEWKKLSFLAMVNNLLGYIIFFFFKKACSSMVKQSALNSLILKKKFGA